jgi:hypothetical protein
MSRKGRPEGPAAGNYRLDICVSFLYLLGNRGHFNRLSFILPVPFRACREAGRLAAAGLANA